MDELHGVLENIETDTEMQQLFVLQASIKLQKLIEINTVETLTRKGELYDEL